MEAIDALEKSAFMLQYDSVRSQIDLQLKSFHKEIDSGALRHEDIAIIKKGYENSTAEFNAILQELKMGFTDPDTRERIASKPDDYTHFLEYRLHNAVEAYNNNCAANIEMLTGNLNGLFGLLEFAMVIQLGKEIWSLIDGQKGKVRQMSGDFFEQQFVTRHKFRSWDQY